MITKQILDNRTKSSFGISIGTGIALEALFTPTDDRYDDNNIITKVKVRYKVLYISLYTLVRNITQSLESKIKNELLISGNYKHLVSVVEEEIETIDALCNLNNVELIVFAYTPVKALAERAINKKPTQAIMLYAAYKEVLSKLKIKEVNNKIPESICLTSIGVDLLGYKGYWLESHTGSCNSYKNFNKKYHMLSGMNYKVLPFNRYLLTMFGDGTPIVPVPKPAERKRMYNCLVLAGVNPSKSEHWCKDKIRQC